MLQSGKLMKSTLKASWLKNNTHKEFVETQRLWTNSSSRIKYFKHQTKWLDKTTTRPIGMVPNKPFNKNMHNAKTRASFTEQ